MLCLTANNEERIKKQLCCIAYKALSISSFVLATVAGVIVSALQLKVPFILLNLLIIYKQQHSLCFNYYRD